MEASFVVSLCPNALYFNFSLRISMIHDPLASQKHNILLDFYLHLLLKHNKRYLVPKRCKELQTKEFSLHY